MIIDCSFSSHEGREARTDGLPWGPARRCPQPVTGAAAPTSLLESARDMAPLPSVLSVRAEPSLPGRQVDQDAFLWHESIPGRSIPGRSIPGRLLRAEAPQAVPLRLDVTRTAMMLLSSATGSSATGSPATGRRCPHGASGKTAGPDRRSRAAVRARAAGAAQERGQPFVPGDGEDRGLRVDIVVPGRRR